MFGPRALADVSPSTASRLAPPSFDSLVRATHPLELYRLSPYVEHRSFPYVLSVVRELRTRIRAVERVVQARQLAVRHPFQVIYGSTFLRHNPVANDLDFMLGVHLGRVSLDPRRPRSAAAELVSRIEAYLEVSGRVFEHYATPALAVSGFSVLEDGKLRQRSEVIRLLAASLAEVGKGNEQRLLVKRADGLGLPTVLSSRESYLYAMTRMQFLSNSVRSVDWMFPGIRRVQMMFHFFADLEVEDAPGAVALIEDLPLHPTFLPSGRVLRLEDQLLWVVPVDTASAGFFTHLALHSPRRMAVSRLDLARQLLADVERNLEIGDIAKALKRLQQTQNALAPALDPSFSSRLGDAVQRFLSDDEILHCHEVAEMAQNVRYVLREPRLIELYGASGELPNTLRRIARDVRELSRRHPRLGGADSDSLYRQTLRLLADLDSSRAAAGRHEADLLLRALVSWGRACVSVFAPTKVRVEEALAGILEQVEAAGIRTLPIYGLADGTVGVPAAEAARLGLSGNIGAGVAAVGGPDLNFRLIASGELTRNDAGEVLQVSDRIWLAVGASSAEGERLQRLKAALTDDWLNFSRVPRADAARLRQRGRELLLGRFGEAASQAWNRSTTGGDGLLALIGTEVEDAAVLLRTHMQIGGEIDAAVEVIPVLENGDAGYRLALQRALRTTSERILESLAVWRTTGGRSGFSVSRAQLAQEQLALLLAALKDLAKSGVRQPATKEMGAGTQVLRMAVARGELEIGLPGQSHSGSAAGISIQVRGNNGGPSSLAPLLRLHISPRGGAEWQLVFFSDRMDWGVHGPSPIDPLEPDHSFFDGMPEPARGRGDGTSGTAGRAVSRYIDERLLPMVLGSR